MTAPQQSVTYQQALVAAAALQAANAPTGAVATTFAMAELAIQARETAAAWAKHVIGLLWGDLDPYDGDAVQEFTEIAAGHMFAAQTATTRAAAGALSRQLAAGGVRLQAAPSNPIDVRAARARVTGGRVRLVHRDVKVDYTDTEGVVKIEAEDTTTQGVLNRPARAYRYAQSQGATTAEADTVARDRLDVLIDDNVMLAQRFAESEMIAAAHDLDISEDREPRVIGQRRIIHPELSRTGTCGLCIVASDQIYQPGTLLPLHDRCKCTTAPVYVDADPADEVNAVDLKALYADAGDTASAALKRTRYQVDEHGELGPVLVPRKPFKPRTIPTRGRAAARI